MYLKLQYEPEGDSEYLNPQPVVLEYDVPLTIVAELISELQDYEIPNA